MGKNGERPPPPPPKKMFTCRKCGFECETLSDLQAHDYAAHGGQPPN